MGLGGGLELGGWMVKWYGWVGGWGKGEVSPGRGGLNRGFLGEIWGVVGGDGATFVAKRGVNHRKLGVLGQTGRSVLPGLRGWSEL